MGDVCNKFHKEDKMGRSTGEILNKWKHTVQSSCGNSEDKNINQVKSDREGVVRFFWLDAQQHYLKSIIYLFGKSFRQSSQSYVTSSLVVRNINRTVYLLPRSNFRNDPNKQVRLRDVYEEFKATIAVSLALKKFESRRVVRSYIHGGEVMRDTEFLQVKYSFAYPEIMQSQGNTFSKIFGNNTHTLETFLLERKIKGPCWLDVKNAKLEGIRTTYCTHEFNCYTEMDVSVVENSSELPMPPLVIASINFKVIHADPKDVRDRDQIVMATCVVQENYCIEEKKMTEREFQKYFCVFTHPKGSKMPDDIHLALEKQEFRQVQNVANEKAVLYYFIEKLAKINPDIVVGHSFYGKQFSVLHKRLGELNLNAPSKLGRLVLKRFPKIYAKFAKLVMCGRWVCDLKISAEESTKCPSYDLLTLCQKIINTELNEIENDDISKFYASSTQLIDLIAASLLDSVYCLRIMHVLNVIPVALGVTRLCGNIMSRTLAGGVSERIEFLLLHTFREREFLTLELWHKKRELAEVTSEVKRTSTYSGGLVLSPKTGLYENLVLYMDFKSLYPCIMQEWNVCFSTFTQDECENAVPLKSTDFGILPSLLKSLTEQRSEIKTLMSSLDRDNPIYEQYNVKQRALKFLANSIYGYLSFDKSRFHAKHLAAFITEKGREILTRTRHLIEQMSYEVIYGDTDSLMIKTNTLDYDKAIQIGTEVCNEVNKQYRHVKLEIEGVFRYLLLLKKKRYAGVTVTKINDELHYTECYKGVDIVRRDCSKICSEISKVVLRHLFNDLPQEQRSHMIYEYLHEAADKVRTEENANQFAIMQQLAKEPTQYSEPNSHAHVRVALRMCESTRQLRKGDIIPYVICNDGTNQPPNLRAYHVEEIKKSPSLKIDYEYYLTNEVFPAVSRLCEPVEFLDKKQIGLSINLEFKRGKENIIQCEMLHDESVRQEPFVYNCRFCKTRNVLTEATVTTFLEHCANEVCLASPQSHMRFIQNQLVLTVRALVKKMLSSELVCDNSICKHITRYIPLNAPYCSKCEFGQLQHSYMLSHLQDQLVYFKKVFLALSNSVVQNSELFFQCRKLEAILDNAMQRYLEVIDLYELFAVFTPTKFNRRELIWTVLEEDFCKEDDISEYFY